MLREAMRVAYILEGPGWHVKDRWRLTACQAWTPDRLFAVLADRADAAPDYVLDSWTALDWARWREAWSRALDEVNVPEQEVLPHASL